jgi:hypothetical protein
MPKKATKKIYSMRRRAIKTMKQAEKRKRQAEEAKRNQRLAFARGAKEFERTSNANNMTHTVPFTNRPVANTQVLSLGNETVNNASWNTYPTNLDILGKPRKGKFQTKRLTTKQKRQLARGQTQKQRNLAMRQARQMKVAERTLENAELVNLNSNKNNVQSMTTEEWYNQLAREQAEEEAEYERLEREYEMKQVRNAEEKMNKAPKNTFTVRINDQDTTTIAKFLSHLRLRKPRKFEIVYLDEDSTKSYYYIFKMKYYENSNNDDYMYGRRGYRDNMYMPSYEMYSKPPSHYFKPVFVPHSYNFYGPNENNDYNTYDAKLLRTVSSNNIINYIRRLPNVTKVIREEQEAKARKEAAKARAPYKLKELQLKGLEGWVKQMEEKTGLTMPGNAQNIVERSIRPFDYRYYQGRDNFQRISTDLFQ